MTGDELQGAKAGDDDTGDASEDILFRVGHSEAGGTILVEFAKPVVWLGMPPKVARQLAGLLTKHADAVEQ